MESTTHGVVLRETLYKDRDKILTFLTADHGKCTVTARGCRSKGSKRLASTQLLVYSELVLDCYRERYTLKEGTPLEQFLKVRQDVETLSLASYFCQVVEEVAREELPDPDLLSLLLNSLYALDQLDIPLPQVKAVFELKLLAILGYEPTLEGCIHCGVEKVKSPYFHPHLGGVHCNTCSKGEGIPISQGILQAMTHVTQGNPKRLFSFSLSKEGLQVMERCTETYLLTQLERSFPTLDFYKQIALSLS